MNDVLAGQIRTVLAGLGGIAVGRGWVDDATAQAVAGGLAMLAASIWSATSKKKGRRA